MKSDRKQELKHNELADWLGERLEALQPHGTTISLVLIGVVGLVLGSIWYFGSTDRTAAAAWSDYFGAFNQREPAKALEKLATDRAGTAPARWALQATADMYAAQGAAAMFTDRAEAQKLLEQAEAHYKQVEATATDDMLKARARLGLGKVYESLCKPADAQKLYALVAESHKDTAIGKAAAADAARMKDSRQVELLAWFATQQPKRPAPLPGLGGSLPGGLPSLPDRPDISPPAGLGLDNLGSTPTSPSPPAFPPPGDTQPGDAPAATPPAEAAPPAESPPAASPAAAPAPTSPAPTSPAPTSPAPTSPAPTSPAPPAGEGAAESAPPATAEPK